MGISIYILVEAYQRLQHPSEVVALPVLIVVPPWDWASIWHRSSCCIKARRAQSTPERLTWRFLAIRSATFGVILSSVIVLTSHWYQADAIISGIIGIAILPRTWLLLTECINVLMEGTPGHIDLSALRAAILEVDGVLDVHDIHVWTITSGLDAMSGHVAIDMRAPAEQVLTSVTKLLNEEFGLHHTTIQVEQVECKGAEPCGGSANPDTKTG